MPSVLEPFRFVRIALAGWMDQNQQSHPARAMTLKPMPERLVDLHNCARFRIAAKFQCV
jgi:hypothetical protein